jgi:hypothetical protein
MFDELQTNEKEREMDDARQQDEHADQAPARRRRADLALVASYIHQLSARHAGERSDPRADAARP